jgi:spore maturation protein CgeB
MKILYLGCDDGTCLDRANAYRRLGHEVEHIDPRRLLPRTGWVDRLTWRIGGQVFAPAVRSRLARRLEGRRYALCHVDCGEWVTPGVIRQLRRHADAIINYNADDPLGRRDMRRFAAYRSALAHYDHVFVPRESNVREARDYGARSVTRVWFAADETSHHPRPLCAEDHRRWDCDVLFLGTWMPERGPLLLRLAELGVPLSIRGGRWHKAPEWKRLARYWKGPALGGDDYAKAIQCARVCLGLISKGNRDLHTTRSLEIPSLGSVLCAERTSEHQQMYAEGDEAVFWSTAEECADACEKLLANDAERIRIAARGRARLMKNGHMNETVMRGLLETAGVAR